MILKSFFSYKVIGVAEPIQIRRDKLCKTVGTIDEEYVFSGRYLSKLLIVILYSQSAYKVEPKLTLIQNN